MYQGLMRLFNTLIMDVHDKGILFFVWSVASVSGQNQPNKCK